MNWPTVYCRAALPSSSCPRLPEVEIAARRLRAALDGAEVESALAPGMVALKSFDPPLDALEGRVDRGGAPDREDAGRRVRRRLGRPLELLVHLMSAGRLQVFDKRASLNDRRSRLLIRLADGRELRLREFGTKQRAWAKLLRDGRGRRRRDGRHARTRGVARAAARELAAADRPAAPPAPAAARPARDRRHRALVGRRDPLGGAPVAVPARASDLDDEEVERLHGGARRARRRDRPLRGGDRRRGPRQDADAAAGPPPRGRAVPALRHDARGGPLRRARDDATAPRSRPGAGCSRTVASRGC